MAKVYVCIGLPDKHKEGLICCKVYERSIDHCLMSGHILVLVICKSNYGTTMVVWVKTVLKVAFYSANIILVF